MARSEKNLTAVFTDTASAIRAKTGTTEQICPLDFADKINAIETGGGTGGGMKAYFEAGGKCAYSTASSFDGVINYSDTENVTSFENMFNGCQNLTKIPNVDMTKAKSASQCFSNCFNMQGNINITTSATRMPFMFNNCSKINSLHLISTVDSPSSRVEFSYLCSSCGSLETLSIIAPNASSFNRLCSDSGVVDVSIAQLREQTGLFYDGMLDSYNIDYSWAFYNCHDLETVTLDIGSTKKGESSHIDMSYAFYNDNQTEITTAPLIITFLNADKDVDRNFDHAFGNNGNIEHLPAVNCWGALGLDTAFQGCKNLLDLKFYNISQVIDISSCTLMPRDSLVEVLNNLVTITPPPTSPVKCILGETNLAKLTDEDKAIATNKGWTLA